MIGTSVGKYRIIDRLGRGGMGIVYKGLDETLHREVAIKVLNPDITDSELLKRFRSEAISLARLNHPGIATIYELHQHGEDMLMVMEFVRGETLQSFSERVGPLEPPQAAHICIQILNALSHAHRAGIVHRDLKPANVMVTEGGLVKIMDFGIARMLGGEQLTHAGSMMGTPAYMAPEQVLGQEVDGRADLYAVGVLFYRLLSRELPFKADTAIAMAQKQVADAPTPIATFRPNLPSWVEAVLLKALAKAPSDRYQTAEAFRAAILAAVNPGSLDELPTMATAIPAVAGDADMTVAQPGSPDAPTMTRAVPNTGISRPTVPPPPAAASTPASGTIPPTERTGTTVVLGRGQLVGLAAVFVVLIAGLAALGYAAFKRNGDTPAPVASAPADVPPAETTPATTDPAADPAAAATPQPPVDTAAASPPAAPGAATAPAGPPSDAVQASGTAGRNTSRSGRGTKPVPAESAPSTTTPPTSDAAAPATPDPAPAPPPAPVVAPITFEGIKALVRQGNSMRESDAKMTLTGGEVEIATDGKPLANLPFSSINQAFYSRSKEPKWKGSDGREQSVDVDLGRMSFFRGERNWLILLGGPEPVFVRFEDGQMQAAFNAFQQRTGIKIQR